MGKLSESQPQIIPSSTSPSPGKAVVGSEASRDTSSGCRDANWMVVSPVVAPSSRLVMVDRDHSPNGSAAAFLREREHEA